MFSSFWQIEEEKECERGKQRGTEVEAVGETVVVSVSLFTVYDFVQLLTPPFGKRAAGTTCLLWSACAAWRKTAQVS